MLSIDRLDVELLEMLAADARRGIVEMAQALGISRNTVQSRLRRLADGGLISGYRPEFDLAKAGVAMQAFVGLEVQQALLSAIVDALAEIPHVLEIHATTGREDLLVRVATASQAGLLELVEQIVGIPGVVHSTTTLALTTPLPYRAVPLLKDMTRDAGWGRSAPTPRG